jgi:prophage antirepressor-like protein
MSDVAIFNNPEFGSIRTMTGPDGDPWFVASDVAKSLGYERPAEAVQDHCKKVNKITQHADSPNRPPVNFNIIPEADVYRLIMRSNLPSAERFQDWVMEDVLPAIRKSGMYAADKEIEAARQLGRAEGAKAAMLLSPYDLDEMRRVLRYRERGFTKGETALVMNRAISRVDKYLHMASSLGILPPVNYSWRKPESMTFDFPVQADSVEQ